MKNAIFICLIILLGIVMAETAVEDKIRSLVEGDGTELADEIKEEDVSIPWDAWVSWGVGGFIMLFVIASVIWKLAPKCCPKK